MVKKPLLILLIGSFILFQQNALAQCTAGQIDINQASLNELEKISGIGPVYAQRIIDGRPFNSLDDLVQVKGIGKRTLDKIKSQGKACVSNSQTDSQEAGKNASSTESLPQEQKISTSSQAMASAPILNHPPEADAGENIVANIGSVIHFDGSKSKDQDGDKLNFFWNLGNGETKNEESFNYSYKHTGQYVVVLQVSDGRSIDSDTLVASIHPSDVFISEFLPNPKGKDEEGEWIEMANSSDDLVDISGWQIQVGDTKTKQFTFPVNSFLLPKTFLTLDSKTTKLILNNTQGSIRLLSSFGEIVNEVSYQGVKEGMSAAKKGGKFFWTDLPTPGMKNIIFLKQAETKPKKSASAVPSPELPFNKRQSFLPLGKKQAVMLNQKSVLTDNLAGTRYNVSFPSLNDLDQIFVSKSALAKNSENSPEQGNQPVLRQKFSLSRAMTVSDEKAKLILVLSVFISSFLFGLWGIVLKNKFFS